MNAQGPMGWLPVPGGLQVKADMGAPGAVCRGPPRPWGHLPTGSSVQRPLGRKAGSCPRQTQSRVCISGLGSACWGLIFISWTWVPKTSLCLSCGLNRWPTWSGRATGAFLTQTLAGSPEYTPSPLPRVTKNEYTPEPCLYKNPNTQKFFSRCLCPKYF